MQYSLPSVDKIPSLSSKTVLVRIDSDVTIEDGVVKDATRLDCSLKTIEYLLNQGAGVILVGHLGRPKGEVKEEFTLLPVASYFEKKFHGEVEEVKLGEFNGWSINEKLYLLENIRFFKGEEENDSVFAKSLASLADDYVNESFATCHRAHASVDAVTQFLPSYAGYHLLEEVSVLSRVMDEPERPLVVVIGGAKLETKLPMVHKMHDVSDYELVGGKIASETKALSDEQHQEAAEKESAELVVAALIEDGKDITLESAQKFAEIIKRSKTVIWNGPMGYVEEESSQKGTLIVAEAIIDSGAYSVVGGGDTITFLNSKNILNQFSFVSLGGGAMLSFLSGENLPGLDALMRNNQ